MLRILRKKGIAPFKQWKSSPGFTLLELLVALSILSVLTTILFLSVGASATQTRRIKKRIEEQQHLRLAIQKMATDISSVYWAKGAAHLYFEGTSVSAANGRRDTLRFTTIVFHWRRPGEKVDDLVSVAYTLTGGSGAEGQTLVRIETPLLLGSPSGYTGQVDILGGVKELSFTYLDTQKRESDSWSTRADTDSPALPAAVRVNLVLIRGGGERTVSVLLPLQLGIRSEEDSFSGNTGAPGGN